MWRPLMGSWRRRGWWWMRGRQLWWSGGRSRGLRWRKGNIVSGTEERESSGRLREMKEEQILVMEMAPPGVGGIAVVRLRGRGVDSFLGKHFSGEVGEGQCVHGEIRDGE